MDSTRPQASHPLTSTVDAPLHAEFFTVGQLEQHARLLSRQHTLTPRRQRSVDRLLPRLAETERVFAAAYGLVTDAVTRGRRVTPAAEWFIDNYPLIEEQIRIARRHLPKGYSHQLPRLSNSELRGTPRVYQVAHELISHSHGRIDIDALLAFVSAYQTQAPFELGELWAIPIMLRLALLENLRRVVAIVVDGRLERERANHWVDRMLETAAREPQHVVLVLAEMVNEDRPLTNAFAAEFASRLQGQAPALVFAVSWLEQRLAERGETLAQVFHVAGQGQAANQVAVGNTIGSLRLLSATDWRVFVERISVVEQTLRADASYPKMAFETRDSYRHAVEDIARRARTDENTVAQIAIAMAAPQAPAPQAPAPNMALDDTRRHHVGYFLIDDGQAELLRRMGVHARGHNLGVRLFAYVFAIALLSGGLAAVLHRALVGDVIFGAASALCALLLLLCASHLASAVVQWLATWWMLPRLLPRMDFTLGIPQAQNTIVAVPTLIASPADGERQLEALEVRYLANRDAQLSFALVSDFKDAISLELPDDDATLRSVVAGIHALNAKYARDPVQGPFFLLHRARRWNPREGCFMGWERKRGKLEEFNAALRGDTSGFHTMVGDVARLLHTRFVIVLDADTELPRDAAQQLIATMAHPLNRPHYDEKLGRVTSGYAILQPRVGITMASASSTRFVQLFAGEPGIDPYTRAVSDVYQDLFAEGSFVGKGIYDIDTMSRALHGRFPENRVLSHDLLEGAYARSGLVSDVLLVEDHPEAHATDMARRARWTRGDWQILPWLWPIVRNGSGHFVRNRLSALSRYKIFDNLRRSLVPAALLASVVLGLLRPTVAPFVPLLAWLALALPGLLVTAAALMRQPREVPYRVHVRDAMTACGHRLVTDTLTLAWLPYDAFTSLASIGRATIRSLVTGRRMLEWRTAHDTHHAARHGLGGAYRTMWMGPVTALAIATSRLVTHDSSDIATAILLVLFAVGPALSWWLSQPLLDVQPALEQDDQLFLHTLARRTWRFFETLVTAIDNDLPPDNFQEDPPQGTAHRTSPTNIGLALTSALAAHDFGYISTGALMDRVDRTLNTLDRLERHRGHLLNWYDTRTLQPLRPLYVSTVDSGNCAGHLLILAEGLRQLENEPLVGAQVFDGLATTLQLYTDAAHAAGSDEGEQKAQTITAALGTPQRRQTRAESVLREVMETARALPRVSEETRYWAQSLVLQCEQPLADLQLLLASAGDDSASQTALPTLAALAQSAHGAAAATRIQALRQLAERCTAFADVDYRFLYDEARHLLSVGCDVAAHRLDNSFYDLLASEARLASYVAVAQGKLPQEHWFHLGRSLTLSGRQPALLSWSGSMFEYLMPLLIMPTWNNTLLHSTCEGIVRRQIAFGLERGVAWGVSESGYAKTDANLNYQYQAFGVPGLGFKRGLANDLVITPYASALALMVDRVAATKNLQRLADEGRLGPLGFYEAIDHTKSRMPPGKDSVTIRSYMAHHQGMIFLSLAYALLDKPMQRRFEASPALRATSLLLQERIPKAPPLYPHPKEVSIAGLASTESVQNTRVFSTPHTPLPEVHFLSNGSYHVAITNSGGGSSRCRDLAVTRFREDPTRDCWGSFGYLRDVDTGAFWSTTHQPTLKRAKSYHAAFSQGRAELRRLDGDMESVVEISVSPEDDVELRRVSLTNHGRTPRHIEFTTYAEVVLAPAASDVAHPAFSNLFVETELLQDAGAVLCTRRPRSGGEHPPWLLHVVNVHAETLGATTFATHRAGFVGRGRTPADPVAMYTPHLDNSAGAVLDPIVAIRNVVRILPHETVRIDVLTGIADSRAQALLLVEKCRDRHAADRLLELAWTQSQVVLRQLDVSDADTQLYERLASNIMFASPALRTPANVVAQNRGGQSGLWAHGISGDLPIVLLRIGDIADIELVRQVAKAHAYLRLKGMQFDLVIWNEDPSGYHQLLQEQIVALVSTPTSPLDKPGGIFIRRSEQISPEDRLLLASAARVSLSDAGGTLCEQLDRRATSDALPMLFAPREWRRAPGTTRAPVRADLREYNGIGGFTPDGREYVITTTRDTPTPAPWVNVLANPSFGSVVSESGSAYTWCENAHAHRLTPWNNDPVSDVGGEAVYLRDEEDGSYWSPTSQPAPTAQPYTTRHGFGYSVFEHETADRIRSTLSTFVAIDAPVKFVVVKVANHSGRKRRLSLTATFDLVLGATRAANLPHIITELDLKSGALLAHNTWDRDFAHRIAFLDVSEIERSVSGDRADTVGRNGTPAAPVCMTRGRLSGRVGACLDPCLAMRVTIELDDGQEREVAFMLGSASDRADARTLLSRFRGITGAQTALDEVWRYWNRAVSAIHVETPDETLNHLANGWLIYQVIAARMWARSGFYQSGGAFGFRDQLQDAMALVHTEPGLLRAQIVRCAARQFHEGDVQHWWHPPAGRGVRTRISDDYLWLPAAICRYVDATGDRTVLDEQVPFLVGRTVKSDEDSYYDLPARSEDSATIYQHARLAIEHGLRFGVHGLPLMGSGDWNDGMNLVGDHGQGESVWLAFFLYDVLQRFCALATTRQDHDTAQRFTDQAAALAKNVEAHAWDGEWYRRAYFDDGTPLGSRENVDCQIDALPQSFAMLTQLGDPVRARQALDAVDARLVNRKLQLIQLFDPPFDHTTQRPGYIQGYVPGVRENGGQYTHAAVWTTMAFAAANDAPRAWELFDLINPIRHGNSQDAIARYQVEPYVVAADVYTNPQHQGRGGWTWYTGSAGWMYRLIIESLLGLTRESDTLRIAPLMPEAWTGFLVHYRYLDTLHHLRIHNTGVGRNVRRLVVDGVLSTSTTLQLLNDGKEHWIDVDIGS